jgi:hypothetical protein
MMAKIYEVRAGALGAYGPWLELDFIASGNQPVPLNLRSWQLDKLSSSKYDGQLHWFENEGDKEAHLTTFVDGWINVMLAPNTLQQPRVRFAGFGVFGMMLRVVVDALIVLPDYKNPPSDRKIPAGVEPPMIDAGTRARYLRHIG